MFGYALIGLTFAFVAAAQPGQFQAYLIAQSVAAGWRRTIPAVFAPVLSDVPIVTVVLLVLSRMPALFVSVLQLAGGVFLLYLAAGAMRSWRDYRESAAPASGTPRQTLLKAALVNVLNPNPWISWTLILGPLLVRTWRERPANAIALVAAFYATLFVASAAIVVAASAARSLGPRVARILIAISGVGLAGFGAWQLWSGGTAVAKLV